MEIAISIATTIGSLLLGFFVLARDRKSATNIYFALMMILVGCYSIFNYLSLHSVTNGEAFLWAKLILYASIFIGPLFYFFVKTFPNSKFFFNKKVQFPIIIWACVNVVLVYRALIFESVTLDNGDLSITYGPLLPSFGLLQIASILSASVVLIKRYKKSEGILKAQLRFITYGIIISFVAALLVTLILPLLRITYFISLSPFFFLTAGIAIAYSIIRYHFLDIRIFLRRAFVIGGALIASVAINMNLLYLDAVVFNWIIPAAVAGPIALVLGIGLFEWFRKLFLKFANKYFFTTLYDQQQVLEDLASKMSRTIQLREVVETVSQTISKTLGIEHYGIYFLTKNKNDNYKPQALIEAGFETNTSQKILHDQFLYSYLSKSNEALVREEMARFLEEETARPKHTVEHLRLGLAQLIEELKQAGIAVVVPLSSSGNLVSILFLGNKLTKDAFTVQDIHLLETIADQAVVAIENARLYEEAQQFTIKLKHEVEKATAELKEANAQLKELDQAKSEFMSIASHQLRTPLAGIIGYLSMLLEGDYGKLTKQNQPVVADVFQAAQRLVRLVNTLLNVTRIEAGRFTLSYVPTDIVVMVEDEVKELQPTADKRNLKLIFQKPKQADLRADVDEKIREVFINLIDNAIKYTQEGSVTVSIAPEGKDSIHLIVADTGIGIAKGDAAHLFEKFVRGSSVARIQPNGSGLGLYIVKQIVEGHHGKIWAVSEGVGKGTTFHVVIPIKQKEKEFKAGAKRVFHAESINGNVNSPLQKINEPSK